MALNSRATDIMYVCPMHPEVRQEGPGTCPKCHMALVSEEKAKLRVHIPSQSSLRPVTLKSYAPLLVVIGYIVAIAGIIAPSWTEFVINFMTGFFLVFSAFKLMDLQGFAEGYSTYDLLAQKWFGYGYVYPFIELSFGLLMLTGFHPVWLLWTEFAVMAFSGIGVAIKLAKGEEFQCACLGTFLKVPLTYVTLLEDFGMALLALVLIFWL